MRLLTRLERYTFCASVSTTIVAYKAQIHTGVKYYTYFIDARLPFCEYELHEKSRYGLFGYYYLNQIPIYISDMV
jgi:hypothetical protein